MKRMIRIWAPLAVSAVAVPAFAATPFSDSLTTPSSNFSTESPESGRAITYGSGGATFGSASGGDGGRNILYTNDNNYLGTSFNAFVTTTLASSAQVLYFGMGTGVIGTYGEADLVFPGNGPDTQNQNHTIVSGTVHLNLNLNSNPGTYRVNGPASNAENQQTTFAGASDGTDRIEMIYDSVASTVQYAVEFNYTPGSAFVPTAFTTPLDISSGDFTTGSSIYLESDDGGTLSDFSVATAPEPASLGLLSFGALGLLARRRRTT